MLSHVGFFSGLSVIAQERSTASHDGSGSLRGVAPHPESASDDLGLPPNPTNQRSKPKSLVRLLPASSICPMVGLRQGRLRPDQGVPKRANLELSRFPALLHEVPTLKEQRMNHAHHESTCRPRSTGRTHRSGMNAGPQVRVTLSDDLLSHLRQTAQEKHVPLRWLVAGLVCDTFETGVERSVDRMLALTGH
jgi:hypothetical protein